MFEGKRVDAQIYQILLLDLVLEVKFGCTYFFYTLYPGTKNKQYCFNESFFAILNKREGFQVSKLRKKKKGMQIRGKDFIKKIRAGLQESKIRWGNKELGLRLICQDLIRRSVDDGVQVDWFGLWEWNYTKVGWKFKKVKVLKVVGFTNYDLILFIFVFFVVCYLLFGIIDEQRNDVGK